MSFLAKIITKTLKCLEACGTLSVCFSLPSTEFEQKMIIFLSQFSVFSLVVVMAIPTQREKRQTNFGSGSSQQQPSFSNSQQPTTGGGSNSGTISNADTENRIFFGNPAIDNGLLGAGLGIGGLLLAQNIANSNNQCNCGGSGRKRRQIQAGKADPNQKFFGLFGGGSNCNCAPSTEFGTDCKGRPQGDRFYGCGCSNNSSGGLFSFGRRKRQINNNGDDVDNLCEGAANEVVNASEDVSTYNALLKKFSTFLHPNHYLSTRSIMK